MVVVGIRTGLTISQRPGYYSRAIFSRLIDPAKRPAVSKDDAHGLYVMKVTERVDKAVAAHLFDSLDAESGGMPGDA
jgi:hypothetical protein